MYPKSLAVNFPLHYYEGVDPSIINNGSALRIAVYLKVPKRTLPHVPKCLGTYLPYSSTYFLQPNVLKASIRRVPLHKVKYVAP